MSAVVVIGMGVVLDAMPVHCCCPGRWRFSRTAVCMIVHVMARIIVNVVIVLMVMRAVIVMVIVFMIVMRMAVRVRGRSSRKTVRGPAAE